MKNQRLRSRERHAQTGTKRSVARYVFLLAAITSIGARAQIAFTWDDLPAHSSLPPGQTRVEIATSILTAMREAKLPPAYGFVNGIRTVQEPNSAAVLDLWRAAGYPLGNHTWSHMNLNQHSVEDFEADVVKNEPLLEAKAGASDWHWLRYPYLAEGDTPAKRAAIREFLLKRHYRIAAVTMSFHDYAWNEPYARCIARHDDAGIQKLEQSYLAAADSTLDDTRAMAKTLYGHDIPYVLLMHVGAFDAKMLPRLLALYRSRGMAFLTLEEAQKDPFYKVDQDLALPAATPTLESALAARHLPVPAHAGPPDFAAVCR